MAPRRYWFGRAHGYLLVRDGKEYDSEAVVGAAHRHRHGVALTLAEVSGGDAIIRPLLECLGFAVRVRRNPHWTWEEVVLGLRPSSATTTGPTSPRKTLEPS